MITCCHFDVFCCAHDYHLHKRKVLLHVVDMYHNADPKPRNHMHDLLQVKNVSTESFKCIHHDYLSNKEDLFSRARIHNPLQSQGKFKSNAYFKFHLTDHPKYSLDPSNNCSGELFQSISESTITISKSANCAKLANMVQNVGT